jgi:hypothetical protein
MRHLAIALAAMLLGACATEPPASPVAPAAGPVAASPVSAGQAPASQPATPPEADSLPPGYRLVERKGVTLVCTRNTDTGSRVNKETCMTEAEFVEMRARGQSPWLDLRNSVTTCGGTGAGACRSGGT